MKSAKDIEGITSPQEAFMVFHWIGPKQSQAQGDVEYHTAGAGRDSDFG